MKKMKVNKVDRSVEDLKGACSCCGATGHLILPVSFPHEGWDLRDDVRVCHTCWESGMIGHMLKNGERVKASLLTRLNWLDARRGE